MRETKVYLSVGYGYLRPMRNAPMPCPAMAEVLTRLRRPWWRYLIVQTVDAPLIPGWVTRYNVVGRTWTRRGAERVVRALRRAA